MKKDLLKTLAPQPTAVVEHEDTELNDSARSVSPVRPAVGRVTDLSRRFADDDDSAE